MTNDLILLLNPESCPKCQTRRRAGHTGKCHNCGIMLFSGMNNNFKGYWDEVSRDFYAFHPQHGWVYSSHIINGFKPNKAFEAEEKLPDDYGMKVTPEQISSGGFSPRDLMV